MASVTLRGRFPAGTTVQLRERRGDFFNANAGVVKTAKVSKDRTVTFSGLPDGGRYWVAAEVDGTVRTAMVTAKSAPKPKVRTRRPSSAESRPAQPGARTSIDRPTKVPRELSERVHQRDVPASVLQRSATPLGMATPKDPDEVVPGLPQRDVPDNVVQRSSTPHGVATVKPVGDEAPAVPQERAKGRQRSDTPTGAAAPKPKPAPKRKPASKRQAAVKAAKDRDAERSQKALRNGAQKVSRSRARSAKSTTSKEK